MSEREDLFTATAESFLRGERSELGARLNRLYEIEGAALKHPQIRLGPLAHAQNAIDFINANLQALKAGRIPLSKFVQAAHRAVKRVEPVGVEYESGTGVVSSTRILGAAIELAMVDLPEYAPGQGGRTDTVLDWEKSLIRAAVQYFKPEFKTRGSEPGEPDFPLYDRVTRFLKEVYNLERSVHTVRKIWEGGRF